MPRRRSKASFRASAMGRGRRAKAEKKWKNARIHHAKSSAQDSALSVRWDDISSTMKELWYETEWNSAPPKRRDSSSSSWQARNKAKSRAAERGGKKSWSERARKAFFLPPRRWTHIIHQWRRLTANYADIWDDMTLFCLFSPYINRLSSREATFSLKLAIACFQLLVSSINEAFFTAEQRRPANPSTRWCALEEKHETSRLSPDRQLSFALRRGDSSFNNLVYRFSMSFLQRCGGEKYPSDSIEREEEGRRKSFFSHKKASWARRKQNKWLQW